MGMSRATRRASALLALMVALMVGIPASVGRADPGEEPDLAIEVVGLKAGSKRDVVIRVTNISDWWSDVTKATVETVSPNGGQKRTFDIPDMNTAAEEPLPHVYEFTYTLPADCNGHVVKASLSAGANYAGDKEINLDNNTSQSEVCSAGGGTTTTTTKPQTSASPVPAPKPAPATAPDAGAYSEPKKEGGTGKGKPTEPQVFGPDQPETIGADQPKLMAPEMPKVALAPSLETERTISISGARVTWRVSRRDFRGGSSSCFTVGAMTNDPPFRVGWSEIEWFGSPCAAEVWQLAIDFNKTALDAIPEKTITRAVLSFDEVEHPAGCTRMWPGTEEPGVTSNCWRSGSGAPQAKPDGCVVARVPSAEWRNGFGKTLIPFITDPRFPAPKKIGAGQWDVTDAYRWQDNPANRGLIPPGTTPPPIGFGLLLTGAITDINGLEGEDSTSCESQVSNLQLTVTVTVPSPDDAPFRQPR